VNETDISQLLMAAFDDARHTVAPNEDLWSRMRGSLADRRQRRRFRLRLIGGLTTFVLANTTLALALSDYDNGRFTMPWWVIEVITNIVLIALAVALGPFIKRFGRAYAADVFRENPRTGKSYLVLTDVAYYLIFASFILFTVTFVAPEDWLASTGEQLKDEVGRVGGILLIMGLLHAANVVALPVIGNLLSMGSKRSSHAGGSGTPPLAPGTWVVRIEPSGGEESTAQG
jgi:hypothetical protein